MYKKICLLLIPCIFLFLLLACSQTTPEVKNGVLSVVFDFKNDTSLAEVSMSLFSKTDSEIRRFETLTLESLTNHFVWSTKDLIRVADHNRYYIGYNNFKMPSEYRFPTGNYKAVFDTFDGEKIEINLSANVDKKLYNMKSSEIENFLKNKNFRKKIIVYDRDNSVLYLGVMNGPTATIQNIQEEYYDAYYYRMIWISEREDTYILMPPVNFEQDEEDYEYDLYYVD